MFYKDASIRDVLDSVTTVYDFISYQTPAHHLADIWKKSVANVFDEENLFYKVNASGIVQPFIDTEFEINRASALEVLDDSRFGEARKDFDAAYRHLRDGRGKEALRMMFPAVEVAAKVLFPGKFAVLGASEVDRHIAPCLRARYAENQPAINGGNQLLTGMKNWINAAQPYRHGQEVQEPSDPPMDFVIAHLSAGATYLRWMVELCSE